MAFWCVPSQKYPWLYLTPQKTTPSSTNTYIAQHKLFKCKRTVQRVVIINVNLTHAYLCNNTKFINTASLIEQVSGESL
jgi:hypothetical protein